MAQRLDIQRKFAQRSGKVHSVDLHPTEPRLLWSVDSGHVCIPNYQLKPVDVLSVALSKLSVPVRSAKFVPGKQWIVADSNNIFLTVVNYMTGDILKSWMAHDEMISCVAVHPSLPLVLSSSNDRLIKLWNWENNEWRCTQTFVGHKSGVTHVSFNPKDSSTFASTSFDSTVKGWTLGSHEPNYTLEHEGVNCVGHFTCYGTPYLITSSGAARVWDYQRKSCVESQERLTLGGYQHNISCIGFQLDLPIIITGSEDGKLRIWNTRNFRLEKILDHGLGGVCSLSCRKGSERLAIGHEKGIVMIEIARQPSVPSMDSKGNVIWAKDNIHTVSLNVYAGSEVIEGKILSTGTELGKCDLYLESLKYNPDGRFLGVCGDGKYIIYTTTSWKKRISGDAVEFVWSSSGGEYAIKDDASRIKIFNKAFQEKKTLKPTISVERIFGGVLLSLCSTKCIYFHDWDNGKLLHQVEMKVRSKCLRAAGALRSANWVGDNFMYINSAWRWRLNCYTGGEVYSMYCPTYHLERPMYMVGSLPNQTQLYLFDKDMKIISCPLVKILMEFKKLVMDGDLEAANSVLKSMPASQHNSVAHFLESRGLLKEAYEIAADAEHKFRLAAQLGTLEIEKVASIHKNIGLSEVPIRT